MLKKLATALCMATLWWSCNPIELPPNTITDPVFTFTGQLDAQQLNFVAGDDGIYMHTGYTIDTTQILRSYGNFAHDDSINDGTEALLIVLSGFDPANSLVFDPDSMFRLGERSYAEPQQSLFDEHYIAHIYPADSTGTKVWTLDDQVISVATNANFDLTLPIGNHNIAVTTLPTLLCGEITTFSTSLTLKPEDNAFGLNVYYAQNQGLVAQAITADSIVTYSWALGSIGPILQASAFSGTYCVTATNSQGDNANACITLYTPNNPGQAACITTFITELEYIGSTQPVAQRGRILIQYTDSQGVVWRSDRAAQPASSSFQLIEATPYDPNENGQATYKLRANINCTLYNANMQTRTLTNVQTTFAVATPD